MHYVLAGSLYLTVDALITPSYSSHDAGQPCLADILRDWLPLQLSAAITAGVAPLLFVQILYPQHFYTANLLLAWRWMLLIPILIAAFYALYLIKARFAGRGSRLFRLSLAAFAAACFGFVGFSWTANFTVSTSPSEWSAIYETQRFSLDWLFLGSRVLIWLGGSFCTLSCVLAWQLHVESESELDRNNRRLGIMSIVGLAISLAGAVVHLLRSDPVARDAVFSWIGSVYVIAALIGAAMQLTGWLSAIRGTRSEWLNRLLITLGLVLSLLSVSTIREILRMSILSGPELFELHAESAKVGGLFVFLVFAGLNGFLITLCIVMCRRGIRRE